jgi:hypothetical protein
MVAVADRCCRCTRERGPSCHVFVDAQGYDGGCVCCPTRAGLDVDGSSGDARQGLQLLLLTDIKLPYYNNKHFRFRAAMALGARHDVSSLICVGPVI